MGKTTNKNSNLPWLATFATCLQWISLVLITLILVCPSPWEHNSVSLFIISPQQQSSTGSIGLAVPSSTVSNIYPSSTFSQTASNDSATSTSSLPARYPAVQTAAAESGANIKREPIENAGLAAQQPQIKEVISNSSFPSPLGGDVNVTMANTTRSDQSSSLIQLRLGPLGSCFRTTDGHESCTPAKLAASYQYEGLQSSMNTTASPAFNVQELLPDSMTFYATVLLLLTILLLCVCICTTAHLILLFRHNRQLQQSISASQAISTFFKPASMLQSLVTAITKWFLIVIAMILVVSSGIQKYRLSNAKNAFNSANPIANDSIILQADTGNAFGFAWVSTLLLVIAFWLQRTASRRESAMNNARKELQKSLPQHLINNNNDADGKSSNQTTFLMNNLTRSATLPPYTPPPIQGSQEYGYFPQDMKRGNPNEFDSIAHGLPSLQKAYDFTGRLNVAKSSPPFSTYQNEFLHRQQQQQQMAGSPLRHMNTIPSSSSTKLHQQPQLGNMPSLHYDQSSFGNNTYVHDHTYDLGDYSYNTEVLADDATPNTCDCSFGRNRLDCSYHSTSSDSRSRRLSGLRRQNSHSTFGHHIHRTAGQGAHRLGISYNSSSPNGQDGGRSVSPAPSYWTSSSAPAGLTSTTVLQQEWGRQEKERQRLFMAELRAQRAAMHSR